MKYMVFKPSFDATDRLFDDIKNLENIEYKNSPIGNRWIRAIYNRLLNVLPTSMISPLISWNFLKQKDDADTVYLYIGFENVKIACQSGYIEYIKGRYSNSYHVGYLTDIHAARTLDIKHTKRMFDMLYIFDREEAKKMGIDYYPLPYSKVVPGDNLLGEKIKSADLYFVGQAKSRYTDLIHIFEYCESHSITTNFYIVGVSKKDRKYEDKIHYIDFVPYEQALAVMQKSKCGLELKLDDVDSFSNRVYEALLNGKRLVTNNFRIGQESFYDREKILIFSKVEEIDPTFVKENGDVEEGIVNPFSPQFFLQAIEKEIKKEAGNENK